MEVYPISIHGHGRCNLSAPFTLSATSLCKGGSAAAYYACLSGFRFSPRDWARPVAKRKVTGGTWRPSSGQSLHWGSEESIESHARARRVFLQVATSIDSLEQSSG